jgi:arylsulfatase
MRIISFVFVFLGIFSNSFCQSQNLSTSKKLPNIILVLMDDMGYGDLAVTGALNFQTPNIDKFASEGMRFTNFLVGQPVCTASRAALLTGCYPNRIGLYGAIMPHSEIGLNPDEVNLARLLKNKGYKTSMIGKWHLGDARDLMPLQQGFDEYYGLPYSNDMWLVGYDGKIHPEDPIKGKYKDLPLPLIEGNNTKQVIESLKDQEQLTTLYTKRAVSIIEKSNKTPFFLYLAHSMPHVPLAVSDKFKGKSKQGLYGDVMMEVDWSIGEVMNALKRKGIDKNTLVIFTSDNGPWLKWGNHSGSGGGFREGKMTVYEGGSRVPCLMRWKGTIPEGVICNQLTSSLDVFPTLAKIVGAKLPEHKIDGVDIGGLLKGNFESTPRKYFYYYYNKNDLKAVRRDNWKLILPCKPTLTFDELPRGKDGFPGQTTEKEIQLALYDLANDPSERYDVKEQYPEIVAELKRLADTARTELGDDLTNKKGNGDIRQPGKAKWQ